MSEAVNSPLPSHSCVLLEVKLLAQRVGEIRSVLSLLAWACGIRCTSQQLRDLREPVPNVDLVFDKRRKLREGWVWRFLRDRLSSELHIGKSTVERFMAARWKLGLDPAKRNHQEIQVLLEEVLAASPANLTGVARALGLREITDREYGRTPLIDILLDKLHEEFETVARDLPRPKLSRPPADSGATRAMQGKGNEQPAGDGLPAVDDVSRALTGEQPARTAPKDNDLPEVVVNIGALTVELGPAKCEFTDSQPFDVMKRLAKRPDMALTANKSAVSRLRKMLKDADLSVIAEAIVPKGGGRYALMKDKLNRGLKIIEPPLLQAE